MIFQTLTLRLAPILSWIIFFGMQSAPAAAADATGTWLTEDGRARVRIQRCGPEGTQLCGYIVWASKMLDDNGKPFLDNTNPDPKKKSRPLLGHQMILGLKLNNAGRFEGKVYSGDNGKSYDVTIWSEQPAELLIRGCMLAVLCGTQTWTRVTDVLPGQLVGATDAPGGPRSDVEWVPRAGAASGAGGVQKSRPTKALPH